MKKCIALLLAVLCLSAFALPVYAEEEPNTDAIWKLYRETLEPLHGQQPAVFAEYDETRGYLIIKGVQGPLLQHLIANYDAYNTMFPGYYFRCEILTDVKFDDGPWRSQKMHDTELYDVFTPQMPKVTEWTDGVFGYVLFEMDKYNAEYDKLGFWSQVIEEKNGRNYIDFSKHTMYVKTTIYYSWITEGTSVGCEDRGTIVSTLHNGETSVQITPDKPDIKDAVLNITDKQMLLSLNKSSAIQDMLNYGMPVEIVMTYKVNNGAESAEIFTEITSREPTVVLDAPQELASVGGDDTVTLLIRYRNAKTGEISEPAEITPTIKNSEEFTQIIPQGAVIQTTPKCRLCKTCSQPLGMCMWTVVGAAISAVLVIASAAWYIILTIRRRKQNNA